MAMRLCMSPDNGGTAAAPRGAAIPGGARGATLQPRLDEGAHPFDDAAMKQNRLLPVLFLLLAAPVAVLLTLRGMKPGPEAQAPQAKQAGESIEEAPVATLEKNGGLLLDGGLVSFHTPGEKLQRRFPRARPVYVLAGSRLHWVPVAQILRVLGERGLDVRVAAQPANAGG